MVEGEAGEILDRVPIRVAGQLGIEIARDESQIGGCELALLRRPIRIAERLELLEMGELPDVDLRGQVDPDRLFESLAGREVATRERPGAAERLARPLPEQYLQLAGSYLEDDGQRDMGGVGAGNLGLRFSPHSRKP